MKRQLSAIAAVAVPAGAVLVTAPISHAATRVPVSSYIDSMSLVQDGLGRYAGWYHHLDVTQTVNTSPLAAEDTWDETGFHGRTPFSADGVWYLVDGRTYAKQNNAPWTVGMLTPTALRTRAAQASPYYEMTLVTSIPGLRKIAPGFYQVTATSAQAGTFLKTEYGLTVKDLTGVGIQRVTIDLEVSRQGRPLSYTTRGKSALEKLWIGESFTNYNTQLPITAPR